MSFLESVLLKNGFDFISILDFPLFVIRFLFGPFHFALFLGNPSFVGLAKAMGQVGRDFTFQSSLLLKLFLKNNRRRKIPFILFS